MPVSIDSNSTSGFYNEEQSLKVAGNGPNRPLEPNSWSDFGGDLKTMAREPITRDRQRRKGTVTDLDVVGGFATDLTQNNLTRLLQGFLFSDARVKPTNAPVSWFPSRTISPAGLTSSQVATGFGGFEMLAGLFGAGAGNTFVMAGGSTFAALGVKVGHIIKTRGFINPANNFVWYVTALSNGNNTIAVTPYDGLFTELSNGNYDRQVQATAVEAYNVNSAFDVVGFSLSVAATLTVGSGAQSFLIDNTNDFTTLGLISGEFVYLGDYDANDGTAKYFDGDNGPIRGFGRIATITAHKITFAVTMFDNAVYAAGDGWTGTTSSGAINMFFGTVIKNESDPAKIIRRTYTITRTLGTDATSQNIYEKITGAVPNQLTMDTKSNDKLTCDLSFVAMDHQQLTGTVTGLAPLGEEPFNTSQDVFAMLLYIIDASQSEQAPLFGYATDEKLTINNNVKANKAIAVVGGFEASVGMFDVSGSLSCYFDDERAISAIRNNADVGLTNVFAKKNEGFIIDLPLLTLGGGRLKVTKDTPIMADITHAAAAGANATTVLYNKFPLLPAPAMPNYAAIAIDGQ